MSYDVFISFKNSGKDGKATPDATAARGVYDALKSAGMKVFFSEEYLQWYLIGNNIINGNSLAGYWKPEYEVIGNIYENPELLKDL